MAKKVKDLTRTEKEEMQRFLMKTLTLGTKARTLQYNHQANVKAHMLAKSNAKVIRNGLSFFKQVVKRFSGLKGDLLVTGIFID